MPLETKHFYDFKNFRVDPDERVLVRDGRPVPLTPKAFQMLLILVENHGRIVEKEKLMTEIWADSFVEEGSLSVNARKLRQALGDDASEPKFIETIPRRGYRFIAEVSKPFESHENGNRSNAAAQSQPTVAASRKFFPIGVILLLAIGAIVAVAWYAQNGFSDSKASAPILSSPFSVSKLHSSGDIRIALSADGKYVAFTDEAGGKQSVWLRRLETGENIQIVPPSDDLYYDIAFSHDGQTIYFVRRPEGGHTDLALYRVASSGGIPVMLLARPLDWISISPDDRRISYVVCNLRTDDWCALFIADVDGNNEQRILTRQRAIFIEGSQFSPDGKSIAFWSGGGGGSEPDFRLSLVDLDTGTEKEVLPQKFYNVRNIRWLPSGDELLFLVSDHKEGKSVIWKASVSIGEAAQVTSDAESYLEISLDRKAEKMAAVQIENDFHIVVKDGGEPETLIPASEMSLGPSGTFIYSTFDGDIWSVNRQGGERRQLTTGTGTDFSPRSSHDGRYIFFASNRSGSRQIWRMNANGANPVQVTQTGGFPCGVSPDGKWLYYSSVQRKLVKTSIDGGGDIPVNDDITRVTRPVCSPDGNFIAYFFFDKGFKIGVINTAEGDVVKTLNYGDGKSLALRLAWSPDSQTLNFVTYTDGNNTLWQQLLDEETPRKIADLGPETIRDLAMMPDGKGFAIIRGKWIHNAVLIRGLK